MSDSNKTRVGNRERFQENKSAFVDVFGDPFAKPEPIEGSYTRLKRRSTIQVQHISDETHDTKNPMKPNIYDYFCDVERAVDDALTDTDTQRRFVETYITEESTNALTQSERTKIEQEIGKRLRVRKITPSTRYFKVIRKPLGGSALKKQGQLGL